MNILLHFIILRLNVLEIKLNLLSKIANFNYKVQNCKLHQNEIFDVLSPVVYLGFHFGGGGFNIFLEKWGYLHGAKLGGFGGHAPPRKVLKMVQFGAFWRIFCKIL